MSESHDELNLNSEEEDKKEFHPTVDLFTKEMLEKHLEDNIGPIENVYHDELDLNKVDIYVLSPTSSFPFYTLVTHGMSNKGMNMPEGYENFQYGELICTLPSNWDFSEEGIKNDTSVWIIELMKSLANFPHQYNTFLNWGHSIQNSEEGIPLTKEVNFNSALLVEPHPFISEFSPLKINEDKEVHFYQIVPLYPDELEFKLKNGLDKFLKRYKKQEPAFHIDLSRSSVVQKKRLFKD